MQTTAETGRVVERAGVGMGMCQLRGLVRFWERSGIGTCICESGVQGEVWAGNRNLKGIKTVTKLNRCGLMQMFNCHPANGSPDPPLPLPLSDFQTSWKHLRNPGEIVQAFF